MQEYIYMDYAATTPAAPEVLRGMTAAAEVMWMNPSAVYRHAEPVRAAVEKARGQTADLIHAASTEIFFTSGGTEADNQALTAALEYGGRKGKHIITTKMEHPAVLRTCEYLERTGRAEVTYLDVPSDGVVRPEQIAQAVRPDTVLISVMLANNEVGTIQPIREISEIARANGILLHTDAVQAVGHIPVDVKELQADLLSASGHKFYGPKGTGFLYVRKGLRLPPLIHGGRQEKGRRAGTENIPGMTGMGIAAELAAGSLDQHMKQERKLRDYMTGKMQAEIPHCIVNGSMEKRLPGNVNLSFEGVPAEYILVALDMHNICASAGSACSAGLPDPSHVLRAMGRSNEEAYQAVRFSLSYRNTEEEIDTVVSCTAEAVRRYRAGGRK
ncbi:MAG: cysteine desulfurase [Eubacterium sp.]|nr:cysteine desulfurase [Eubacterium sp.]